MVLYCHHHSWHVFAAYKMERESNVELFYRKVKRKLCVKHDNGRDVIPVTIISLWPIYQHSLLNEAKYSLLDNTLQGDDEKK